jgi:hypothetical protein
MQLQLEAHWQIVSHHPVGQVLAFRSWWLGENSTSPARSQAVLINLETAQS